MLEGTIKKMQANLVSPVEYSLPIGDELIGLNQFLGKKIRLEYAGAIVCSNCGKATKKSYSQGHCFLCMRKLASCDMCIMKPETCHYAAGTCREPEWGESFCFQDHFVYLANSSGIKVGITRHTQVPTRWIDQGASQALPIFKVKTRLQSGLVEVLLKKHVADKTDWRKMLKGAPDTRDLPAERDRLLELVSTELAELKDSVGDDQIELLSDAKTVQIDYPVLTYPEKVSSFNFDKNPVVEGELRGIKGQYLILDKGVINVRKFTSYQVKFDG